MIQTAQLLGAGLGTSKNIFLSSLLNAVNTYNALPATNTKTRVETLDKIMLIASEYLTSKPPKANKVKNTSRWNALTDLANQCGQEALAVGVKQLTSPTDYREIKGDARLASQNYWLERMDPLRRPGFQLSAIYEEWLTSGTHDDFWTFASGHADGGFRKDSANKDMQVKLLGDSQRAKRIKYQATFVKNGCIEDLHGQPFSTLAMHTEASGQNWGIFVLSPEGHLYLHAHKLGRFHHSTFLGGAAATAAGEMVVDESGAIRLITAKTGHYRSGVDEMLRLVRTQPISPDALILPDVVLTLAPPKGQSKALIYRVGDFRANGTSAKPLTKMTVNLRIPSWAKNDKSNRAWFSKVA